LLIYTLAAIIYLNRPTDFAEVVISQKTITAPSGQTKLVRFPEGSTVLLQGGASLSYPENFSGESRNITLLNGKALLDITHDPEHPFIVNSGKAKVEVLGTRFVVNNQPKSIQVTLARGKIRFWSRKTSQLMKPGQQLDYNKNLEVIERLAQVDTSYATAWTRQSLWFDNTPITGVLSELSSVYGVHCKTGPKVDTKRLLNGRFDQLPLSQVLVLLENSTGYRFRLQDGVVRID
jgi:transmembrane sensor